MQTNQDLPLMRKATVVWLVDNTSLTFKQIANFCGFHELEVQGIADGDVATGIMGQNPINSSQLTQEEIDRCQKNPDEPLKLNKGVAYDIKIPGKKAAKYTPIARRGDKPDGISYLLKYHPDITNAQIRKLIGTTNAMIDSIRNKTHWNMKDIKPRDVVLLGLCSQSQFNDLVLDKEEDSKEDKKDLKKKSS